MEESDNTISVDPEDFLKLDAKEEYGHTENKSGKNSSERYLTVPISSLFDVG